MEQINMVVQQRFSNRVDPRRKQELMDKLMIMEDHNAMANCPRMAQHHTFEEDRFIGHFQRYNCKDGKYNRNKL